MVRKLLLAAAFLFAAAGMPSAGLAKDCAMQSAQVTAAMDFLAAIGSGDFDAAGTFLDEGAVLDLPFAGEGITVRGKEGVLGFFRKTMAGSVDRVDYALDHAWPSPEANAVVLEVTTKGRKAGGEEYTNRLVAIFTFRDGRIVLFREYFNPAPLG